MSLPRGHAAKAGPGHLTDVLVDLAEGLPGVSKKRMFGHDALFVNGNIFAVEWDGHVGVRLPSEVEFDRAMALAGSGPFDPGRDGRGMTHWVLLPPVLLDDPREMRAWLERAHGLNAALAARTARPKGAPIGQRRGKKPH